MDLAFVAGTIATLTGVARSDAVQFADKLNDEESKKAVEDAKTWLKSTVKKISDLEQNDCEYLEHWLREDERALSNTKNFFHQARKELKRSLVLTKTQAANPRGLGAKTKRNKSSTRAYPTPPATVEESVESRTSRTENWVNKAEQSASRNVNEGVKTEVSTKDDANAKPLDYNQSMGWPYLIP